MRICVLSVILLASAAGQSKHPEFSSANLPLVFTPNVGQDRANIQFSSRSLGYGIYFTQREIILTMPGAGGQSAVLKMTVGGGNPKTIVSGIDELSSKSNYLLGQNPSQWRTHVSNFGKVMYKQVLPGIDLIYYGRDSRLEYDFRVAPYADPQAIKMLIDGKEWSARVTPSGDLDIVNPSGSVGFARPVAYQVADDGSRLPIRASYALRAGGGFGFDLGRYDRGRELVIDPVLVYSTYHGGKSNESATGIAVDSQGNAYIAGYTSSGELQGTATPGLRDKSATTGFVAKFNSTGTELVYATYLGGASSSSGTFTQANAIAVDGDSNVYVAGTTNSTDFPLKNPAQSVCGPANMSQVSACANGGTPDIFVIKLDSTGTPVYSTYLGGSDDDSAAGIAVNSVGEAFVAGNSQSNASLCQSAPAHSGYPTTADAYLATPVSVDQNCKANSVGFTYPVLSKLGATGDLLYSTYIGSRTQIDGNARSLAKGVALDNGGNVYLTGATNDPTFPVTEGAAQAQCVFCDNSTHYNAWVASFNPAQSGAAGLIYSTFLGGNTYAEGDGIAIDQQGNAYVTGFTDTSSAAGFPTTPGSLQPAPAGGGKSGFITKLNAGGTGQLYSSFLGGTGDTFGSAIAVDAAGSALVAGKTQNGFSFPLVNPLPQAGGSSNVCAGNCGFLVRMSPDGSATSFSTYFGWQGASARGIAADATGNVWLTGHAAPMLTTDGAYSKCHNNCQGSLTSDAFVAKLDMSLSISGQVTDAGSGIGGVEVTLSGSHSASITTDADGNYRFPGLSAGGSYTVSPARGGFASATSRATFDNLASDQTINFTTSGLTISGQIAVAGVPLPGVTVTLTGGTGGVQITDGSGNYSFTGLTTQPSYTVTPSLANTVFTPVSQTVSNISANQVFNFAASTLGDIVTPLYASTLSGSTITFSWTGAGVSGYWLDVGTAPFQGNISAGSTGTATSKVVSGIPLDGNKVFATLYFNINGSYTDASGNYYRHAYFYVAGSKAVITSPAPSSTLGVASAVFTWTPGVGATEYWLDVGTSPSVGNIFGGSVGAATSKQVTGLPSDGSTVYVTLYTKINGSYVGSDGAYLRNSYTYTSLRLAAITSPTQGSTLPGPTVTFSWAAIPGATEYWLDVGTAQFVGNKFGGPVGTATSKQVAGLPLDGSTVYATIYTKLNGSYTDSTGAYLRNNYTYTALKAAAIITPTPGVNLGSPSDTFTWTPVPGATQYWLDVGTSPFVGNIFGGSVGTNTSKQVTGLPFDNSTIYVTLYTQINGSYQDSTGAYFRIAYTYSAAKIAAIFSPTPGATFTSSTVTFTWTPFTGGVTQYWLDVGSAPSQGNFFGGNVGSATSQVVTGLPFNGDPIYVTLYTKVNGSFQDANGGYIRNSYVYTAAAH